MFEPLERAKTVPEQVAGILRGVILRGELEVGERLPSEKELSSQFETNRVSLRQALQMLKVEGLIEGGQGKPWRVSDYREHGGLHLLPYLFEAQGFSEETLRVIGDFLAIRTPVLEEVLGLAIRRMDESQLEGIRGALMALQEAVDGGASTETIFLLDLGWFESLLSASNSILFRSIYRPLSLVYRRFSSVVSMFWQPLEGYPGPLWTIFHELESRNVEEARALLVSYLDEETTRLGAWLETASQTMLGLSWSGFAMDEGLAQGWKIEGEAHE